MKIEIVNLIDMIRTLDIDKNSREDIKSTLIYIADELESVLDKGE